MNDTDLAKALGLTEADASIVIPKLSPEKRKTYERLIELADELNLWTGGIGPKPKNVLIDAERTTLRRWKHK